MHQNQVMFFLLIGLCGIGLVLGAYYYFCPQKVVARRIKPDHKKAAEKDPEFSKWLHSETETQIKRVRKMGLTVIVFEAIWLVMVFSYWQQMINK